MNLGALRRGPNVSEAGARPSAFPPSLQEMDALREPRTSEERRVREERNRQFAEQEAREREQAKLAADRDWTERQLKQQKIEESANAKAAAFMAEKVRLEGELQNAETARNRLAENSSIDCSTVEAAMASIHAQAVSSAAGEVVARCEATLKAHKDSTRIR